MPANNESISSLLLENPFDPIQAYVSELLAITVKLIDPSLYPLQLILSTNTLVLNGFGEGNITSSLKIQPERSIITNS